MKKAKKTPLARVLNVISTIVLIFAILIFVFILFSNLRGEMLFIGDRAPVWVRTDSMEPTIPAQSYVVIRKADSSEVAVGDVILFASDDPRLEGANNLHRVVEIVGDHEEFVTKGDNPQTNPLADKQTAKAEKVIGIYERTLPVLSALVRFLTTPIGIAVTLFVLFALNLLSSLPDLKRASAGRKAKAAQKKQDELDALVQAEVQKLKTEQGAGESEASDPNPESKK